MKKNFANQTFHKLVFRMCLWILPVIVQAQPSWEKSYGLPGTQDYEGLNDGVHANDGHLVGAGYGASRAYMIKANISNGSIIWEKRFSTGNEITSIAKTSDGGFILASENRNFSGNETRIQLIKVNDLGNQVWTKTINGSFRNRPCAIKVTADGGFIIAATCDKDFMNQGSTGDMCLIKTDASGNLVWSKKYSANEWDQAQDAIITNDGGFLIVGATAGTGKSGSYMVKTDATGDTLWTRIVGDAYNEVYAVRQTIDNGYILFNSINQWGKLNLIKIDANGTEQWSKIWKQDLFPASIELMPDGGYIIAADGFTATGAYLARINSTGEIVWESTLGPTDVAASSMVKTSDGGFALFGLKSDISVGYSDAYIIKTDSLGGVSNSNCSLNIGSDTVTICSGQNHHASPSLSVGSGAISYNWTPSTGTSCSNCLTPTLNPSASTTYTLTVIGGGCILKDSIRVNVHSTDIAVSLHTDHDTIVCKAPLLLDAGNPGKKYLWSTGDTTQTAIIQNPGTYLVTVSDSICSISDYIIVSFIQDNIYVTSPKLGGYTSDSLAFLCSNDSLLITAYNQLGKNISYQWSTGSNNPSITTGTPGKYWVNVTADGCSYSDTVWIQSKTISITGLKDTTICFGNSLTFDAGNPGATYQWSTGDTSRMITFTATTPKPVYSLALTVSYNTCLTSAIATIYANPCVWPGDANNNSVSNVVDLLPIGIGYGTTGPVRPNASTNWEGQTAPDWTNFLASGTNYKHIDCNGDGVINLSDANAILKNYGQSHLKTSPVSKAGPQLYLDISVDSVFNNTAVAVPVLLGVSGTPANNLYGVAFTINFDPSLIDSSSLSMEFSNSWLGTIGGNLMSIQYNNYQNGRLDVAVTRINQQNISGYGQIGTLHFITIDNISGKKLLTKKLVLSISNITAIAVNETPVSLSGGMDSLIIKQYDAVGVEKTNSNNSSIVIFPNPATNEFTVQLNNENHVGRIIVTNVLGEIMLKKEFITNKSLSINTQEWTEGVYLISIQIGDNKVIRKLSVVR